jgi:ribose 5-phosphate isomerase B
MKVVVSTDERTHLVDAVLDDLRQRGHQVEYIGPQAGGEADWPEVTRAAVERVADGSADEAIVMCWTGTGASMAANKVPGIRAALCHDAETARGARRWNHANVLALSLRATAAPVAREILEAWFATPCSDDPWNLRQVHRLDEIEEAGLNRPRRAGWRRPRPGGE